MHLGSAPVGCIRAYMRRELEERRRPATCPAVGYTHRMSHAEVKHLFDNEDPTVVELHAEIMQEAFRPLSRHPDAEPLPLPPAEIARPGMQYALTPTPHLRMPLAEISLAEVPPPRSPNPVDPDLPAGWKRYSSSRFQWLLAGCLTFSLICCRFFLSGVFLGGVHLQI